MCTPPPFSNSANPTTIFLVFLLIIKLSDMRKISLVLFYVSTISLRRLIALRTVAAALVLKWRKINNSP